ncbi:MAG: tRNA 4-thiouridine(8) synthase ThiI [Clostridiales bacterium]|nr:tRNA 4-thiouridine(8) synthase ThiI [Clostridiales bacterium]
MKNALLIKYGEIALRGDNRHIYEKYLAKAVRLRLKSFDGLTVSREHGRFLVESDSNDFDFTQLIPYLTKVFGLIGLSPCIMTLDRSIDALCECSIECMRRLVPENRPFTFKVKTRRADKKYPTHSQPVSAAIGDRIIGSFPNATVDVHNPEILLNVEIRYHAYVYVDTIKLPGGLPYGTGGRGMLLLSGGIDSPVAGFLMARRGVRIFAVYFHSPPYTSERARDKVEDIAKALSEYLLDIRLYVVPFTDVQLCVYSQCPPPKLTILLKRAMLTIAETIAQKENCQCLITGDSVGQVASQTLQSMAAAQSGRLLPIIRPLAGMDKQQIINMAQEIGTFDISIRPYEDCCTVFVPEHPETKPVVSAVDAAWRRLPGIEELILSAVEAAEIVDIG